MPKRDISKPTYYIDSCIFIELIEGPATSDRVKIIAQIIEDAEAAKCNLVTSILTVAEVVYAKHEIDKNVLDTAVEGKIDALWHPESSPIQLIDVHELIVRDARHLLRDNIKRGWTKTRGIDAIHLVTAQREFADEFFTNEHAMQKWGEVLGFKVCVPHPLPTPDDLTGQHSMFGMQPMPPNEPGDRKLDI